MSESHRPKPQQTGPGIHRQDWARWTMREFPLHETRLTGSPDADAQMQDSLRSRIEELTEQARATARRQGHEQGHGEGYSKGLEQGVKDGVASGKEQGHADGYQQGYDAGQAASAAEAARLAEAAQACAHALHHLETDVGQALISLAVSIAQQVVRSALQVDNEKILDVVQDILRATDGSQAILRLRVNRDDEALIRRYLSNDPSIQNWRVMADDSIERGGCIAETALGNIDATLQTRWQRIISALGESHPWASTS